MDVLIDPLVRLELNSALMKLIEGWDEAAARLVIRQRHEFPTQGIVRYESISTTRGNDTPISGYTTEYGDVAIKTSTPETNESSFGVREARIGMFKVCKVSNGAVEFHHFWRSDLATRGLDDERPPEYRLGYDPKTLEPLFLGVWEKAPLFTIPCLSITVSSVFLRPIWGKVAGWHKRIYIERFVQILD